MNMVIMGIDPGTERTGYGIIGKNKGILKSIAYGCVVTPKNSENSKRIALIAKELKDIMEKYRPRNVAVEQLFFFKNVKTIISVSEARGSVLLVSSQQNIPIFEYTPLQVKQAVTGYGKADKTQVQKMVKAILNLKEIPKPDDAADALAVAICHAHHLKKYDEHF